MQGIVVTTGMNKNDLTLARDVCRTGSFAREVTGSSAIFVSSSEYPRSSVDGNPTLRQGAKAPACRLALNVYVRSGANTGAPLPLRIWAEFGSVRYVRFRALCVAAGQSSTFFA